MNDAPVLAAIEDKNATTGFALKFTASATDPDAGQTKTFSLISAPTDANINGSSGAFTWTHNTTGSFTFKVRVTDNGTPTLFDEEAITITVPAGIVRLASKEVKSDGYENAKSLTLYPNPVKNTLTVNLPEPATTLSTTISNSTGSEMMVDKHNLVSQNQLQVNVVELPAGLYLFKLQLNYKRETLKFIKQ